MRRSRTANLLFCEISLSFEERTRLFCDFNLNSVTKLLPTFYLMKVNSQYVFSSRLFRRQELVIYSNWSHLLSHDEKGEAWGGNSQQHCREKRLGWEEG